jgi:chromosome segregation ATPase
LNEETQPIETPKTSNFKNESILISKHNLKDIIGQLNEQRISNEVSFKSTQTNETAFVPCESCAKIQADLKANADELINMCHFQNIQSSVGKYRTTLMANQLIGGWLIGADLDKWLVEQNKDLNKLAKQLEYLSKNNELLKTKLKENEANMDKIVSGEKEIRKTLKEEQESRSIVVKQYEKKLAEQRSDMQAKINKLEEEVKNFTNMNNTLGEKCSKLKSLCDNNDKIISELSK